MFTYLLIFEFSCCGGPSSHCGGFSCCGAWTLGTWASCCGSQAPELNSCGAQA